MFLNTILTSKFCFLSAREDGQCYQNQQSWVHSLFTSQTALQCKISSKTECKAVWNVKSRMDPSLSHNSHGSKLLSSAKFTRLARHRKSEILGTMVTCLLWMGRFTKGTEIFYMHFKFSGKYTSCFAIIPFAIIPKIISLFKLIGFKLFSVLKNSIA